MQTFLFDGPEKQGSDKYNKKILAPQYVPKNVKPSVAELYSSSKYAELVSSIKQSNVSEEEKDFLIKAATRHIVFNYDKIADYYAHATPEMQKLMEQSALVIIDFNDAIANGYVKLSSTIKSIVEGSTDGQE
jgi:hypothetical protein